VNKNGRECRKQQKITVEEKEQHDWDEDQERRREQRRKQEDVGNREMTGEEQEQFDRACAEEFT